MSSQKRVAAIHDLSGFGKCSLTIVLPLLSAAGLEACAIPTAVLSTHTGGLDGFTYRDLTDDLEAFGAHWHSLGLHFDAIYSGFLGSARQIQIVSNLFDQLRSPDTLSIVDPCMADKGVLYRVFTHDMVQGMKQLCKKADIIVPNITEACLLLGQEYFPGPYSPKWVEQTLSQLTELGCGTVVLTGVWTQSGQIGAACCGPDQNVHYCFAPQVPGSFHGTGDLFASALTAALLLHFPLENAAQVAVDFTHQVVLRTSRAGTDPRYGVNFEAELPNFLRMLHLI